MHIQPYLIFDGRCDEAIEFYKTAIGAKQVMLMRFKDSPQPPSGPYSPEMANKVIHAEMTIGESRLLLSDGHCTGKPNFAGFSITILVKTDADASSLFTALTNGGKITMPLGKTFFSSNFGMLTDRFGVSWMIYVEK